MLLLLWSGERKGGAFLLWGGVGDAHGSSSSWGGEAGRRASLSEKRSKGKQDQTFSQEQIGRVFLKKRKGWPLLKKERKWKGLWVSKKKRGKC